ncbi:Mitochondrial ATPase complex subunit atp10 [Dimargaris verticillata]|uniref:Mitochondrial ATPase complex subunit atp10 n=1 Tax=Dimargaris verticillata TaxID=2761393 RepID=A0A9W8B118_9FUNG|nr:Mitochondrial ATPase complex subunit atp10 [Dimargaris verticillata]
MLHMQLNIVENILKGAIVRACVPWLAQQVPAEQRGNYLTYFWPIERIKDDLFIQNLALGWVFLVDRDLKVRWYANGIATPKELEQLYAYVAHLQPGAKSPVTE